MKYDKVKHAAHHYKFRPVIEGLAVLIISLVSLQLVIHFIFFHAQEAQKGEIRDGLIRTIKIIGAQVDIAKHKQLRAPEQQHTDLYEQALEPLKLAKESGGDEIEYVYTCIRKDDEGSKGKIYFILDAAEQGDHDNDGVEDKSFVMDPYDDAPKELIDCLEKRIPTYSDKPYTDEWGTHYSAYLPLYKDAALGVDISAANYTSRLEPIKVATNRARVAALLISVLFGLVTWFLRNFARSLNESRLNIRDDYKKLSEEIENA